MKQASTKTAVSFLKEWTPNQFQRMKRAISAHFSDKDIRTAHGNYLAQYCSFTGLDERFGFAYTSSSSYAGYWVCNTEVYSNDHAGYKYVGFAMSTDLKPYAILWDAHENEILLPL